MLTTFDMDEYVYAALRNGASGFLLKDTPPEDLVRAIRVVAAGDALLAPSVTRRLIEDVARRAARPGRRRPGWRRSPSASARCSGSWPGACRTPRSRPTLVLGETTVKTHVGRVLMKLGLRDRVQAVVLAYESGLVTPGR